MRQEPTSVMNSDLSDDEGDDGQDDPHPVQNRDTDIGHQRKGNWTVPQWEVARAVVRAGIMKEAIPLKGWGSNPNS